MKLQHISRHLLAVSVGVCPLRSGGPLGVANHPPAAQKSEYVLHSEFAGADVTS